MAGFRQRNKWLDSFKQKDLVTEVWKRLKK